MSHLVGSYARRIAACVFGIGCAASPRAVLANAPSSSCEGEPSEPGSCAPRPPPDQCVYGGNHKPHTRNLLGAKALVVTSLAITGTADEEGSEHHPQGTHSGLGVSVFYEREVVPKWLEMELNVGLVDGHVALQIPIDLLLKKPFHLGKRVTAYVALGPALELFARSERPPVLGLTGGVGLYLWLSRDFGLDLELDYTIHRLAPGIEHVTTFGVGPVVHF